MTGPGASMPPHRVYRLNRSLRCGAVISWAVVAVLATGSTPDRQGAQSPGSHGDFRPWHAFRRPTAPDRLRTAHRIGDVPRVDQGNQVTTLLNRFSENHKEDERLPVPASSIAERPSPGLQPWHQARLSAIHGLLSAAKVADRSESPPSPSLPPAAKYYGLSRKMTRPFKRCSAYPSLSSCACQNTANANNTRSSPCLVMPVSHLKVCYRPLGFLSDCRC